MAPLPSTACHNCVPLPDNVSQFQASPLHSGHHHGRHGMLKHLPSWVPFAIWPFLLVGLLALYALWLFWAWHRSKQARRERKQRGCTCFRRRDYLTVPKRFWSNNNFCHCGAYNKEQGNPVTQSQAVPPAYQTTAARAAPTADNTAATTAYNPAATNASNTGTTDAGPAQSSNAQTSNSRAADAGSGNQAAQQPATSNSTQVVQQKPAEPAPAQTQTVVTKAA